MSIRSLLTLMAGTALATAVLLVGAGAYTQHNLAERAQRVFVAKDVTADILPPPMYLIEMRLVLGQALDGTMPVADAARDVERLSKEYTDRVAYWRANPPYGLEAQLLGEQHAKGEAFIAAARSGILAPLAEGKADEARAALAQVHALYLAHRAGVDETVKRSAAFSTQESDAFAAERKRGLALAVAVLLAGAGVLAGTAVWVRRRVWSAIGAEPATLAAAASRIAAGDLTTAVQTGVASSLAGTIDRMRQALGAVIETTQQAAGSVATAAQQIAQGNQDLSARTEQQAAALEQTSASMQEIAQRTEAAGSLAAQGRELAERAASLSHAGIESVEKMATTMRAIQESARRIAERTREVDSIAFQTNILALNAAVEAARAGDAGRGFSVVASEVRTLAQRSADTAKTIGEIVVDSVARIDSGVAVADQAKTTTGQATQTAQEVAALMERIDADTQEQARGIAQVNEAVAQMDDGTQRNAALVEQASAAAASLHEQANTLVGAVEVFRVRNAPAPVVQG